MANGDWLVVRLELFGEAVEFVFRLELKVDPPKERVVELAVGAPNELFVWLELLAEIGARFRRVLSVADFCVGGANVRDVDCFAGADVETVERFELDANGESVLGRPKSDFTTGGAKLDFGLMAAPVLLAASPNDVLIDCPADLAASPVFRRRSPAAAFMFDFALLAAALNFPPRELLVEPKELEGFGLNEETGGLVIVRGANPELLPIIGGPPGACANRSGAVGLVVTGFETTTGVFNGL